MAGGDHGVAEGEADMRHGDKAERRPGSSRYLHEEEPGASSSSCLSFASSNDVSFRSSVASSPSSFFSLGLDAESDDGDAMYPPTQCEWEEIPSYRWIRWWKPRKEGDLDKKKAADAWATGERGKGLVHFDGHPVFTLEELSRADAEVLGKGTCCGTTYKFTLEDGYQLAGRRLTWVETTKDFVAKVDMLGRIQHPNLLAPRAYYYKPEGEKFLLFDYMPKGSLSALLHARGDGTPLDWPTRLNIAIGVARGLNYLHTQGNMVHGNLSSESILLDNHLNAKIADYGLSKLLATTINSDMSGYHAPEHSEFNEANNKIDVYSLGVIMLELLTGMSPRGQDLPEWIQSIEEMETTTRLDFKDTQKLALRCASLLPDGRPEVQQVVQQLEKINSTLPSIMYVAATKGRNKPTDEGERAAGTMSMKAPVTEERLAPLFEDAGTGSSNTSSSLANDWNQLQACRTEKIIFSHLASPTSSKEALPTPINSCKDRDVESDESTSPGNLKEHNIPNPSPVEENFQNPSGKEELQAPSLRDCFINLPTARSEVNEEASSFSRFNMGEAMVKDANRESMSMEGNDATFGGIMASPISINWAEVTIEVHLKVPASPPLISSDPDSGYQRFFQTLCHLAHRSPPLASNVLEEQLNRMVLGLHSLGYPLDTWLKAANLVLALTKKREYIDHHVDDYKVKVEAQLNEFTSAMTQVEEEVSRAQSDIVTLEGKQEELDGTITKLEDKLAALKAQQEEVVNSLTTARDVLAVAKAKTESMSVDMDCLNQQYSVISDLRSAMLFELPSLDEVFDSDFHEIMTKKF